MYSYYKQTTNMRRDFLKTRKGSPTYMMLLFRLRFLRVKIQTLPEASLIMSCVVELRRCQPCFRFPILCLTLTASPKQGSLSGEERLWIGRQGEVRPLRQNQCSSEVKQDEENLSEISPFVYAHMSHCLITNNYIYTKKSSFIFSNFYNINIFFRRHFYPKKTFNLLTC